MKMEITSILYQRKLDLKEFCCGFCLGLFKGVVADKIQNCPHFSFKYSHLEYKISSKIGG